MEQLIKISDYNGKKAVSARLLHAFLMVETRFGDWIPRMFQYGFTENIDYSKMSIDNDLFSFDFALTLECAKEISMLQRTEQGKRARLYFIECEKELMKPRELTRKQLALMVIESENALELSEAKNKELAPKAEVYDQISNCTNLKSIGTVAKELGTGVKRLFHFMRSAKIIMPSPSTIPYQQYLDSGYFKVRTVPIKQLGKNQATSYFTAKGEIWIAEKYKKRNPIINVIPEIINQNN
jgi:anti-repressor protein